MANADEMIKDVFDKFCEAYQPATETDCTQTLSSVNIQDILCSIFDEDTISKVTIYEQLIQRGYNYKVMPNEEGFVWMVKTIRN